MRHGWRGRWGARQTSHVEGLRLNDVDYERAARICRRAAKVFEGEGPPEASADDGTVDFMTLLAEV
jgi:hypothetical protein